MRGELDAASEIKSSVAYRLKLEDLKSRFQHSIRVIPAEALQRFNCYAHAFGICESPRYDALVTQTQNSTVMNSDFVKALLARAELMEVPDHEVQVNDIVLYFNGEDLKHAGRVSRIAGGFTVHSKWGGNEVHEHKLWEIPGEYGDRVRFFRPLEETALLDTLEAAYQSGVR